MYARVSCFLWGLGTKTQMLVLVWHEYHQSPQSPSITGLLAVAFGHLSIFVSSPLVFQCFSILAPQTTWQWDQALSWSLVCALQGVYSSWPPPTGWQEQCPVVDTSRCCECPLALWWRAPLLCRSAQRWAQKLSVIFTAAPRVMADLLSRDTAGRPSILVLQLGDEYFTCPRIRTRKKETRLLSDLRKWAFWLELGGLTLNTIKGPYSRVDIKVPNFREI